MKLTFIRHTAVDVPSGICYGFSDVPLKESFEKEAEIIKKQLDGQSFDAVYTSPLSRCTRLAGFCSYGNALRDDRIKELNFGDWEMKSWMEISKEEASGWLADWLNSPAKNGESYVQMKVRVDSFLNELKESADSNVCIFTHGGVIRLAHVYLGIYPLEQSFEFPVEYGQVFELELQNLL